MILKEFQPAKDHTVNRFVRYKNGGIELVTWFNFNGAKWSEVERLSEPSKAVLVALSASKYAECFVSNSGHLVIN